MDRATQWKRLNIGEVSDAEMRKYIMENYDPGDRLKVILMHPSGSRHEFNPTEARQVASPDYSKRIEKYRAAGYTDVSMELLPPLCPLCFSGAKVTYHTEYYDGWCG